MEGVAEVSKRKALLQQAEGRVAATKEKAGREEEDEEEDTGGEKEKSGEGHTPSTFLHPLQAIQEEEKEKAAKVARDAFQTVHNLRREKKRKHIRTRV